MTEEQTKEVLETIEDLKERVGKLEKDIAWSEHDKEKKDES